MKHSNFSSKWLSLHDSNQFLRICSLTMLGINFILVIGVLNKDHAIVLVPQNLSGQAEIAQNKASEGYKKSWGMYAATLLGNVTPENADFVLDSLHGMVTPEIKSIISDQVREDMDTLKAEKVTSSFEIKKISYEPETDKVFVTGKNWITGAGTRSESSSQTFEFNIDIRNYSPIITHLALYQGEAKVQAVVKQEEAKQKAKQDNGK